MPSHSSLFDSFTALLVVPKHFLHQDRFLYSLLWPQSLSYIVFCSSTVPEFAIKKIQLKVSGFQSNALNWFQKIQHIMMEFFPPTWTSGAILSTFPMNYSDGVSFCRMGSHLPRIPPPTPVLYSAVTPLLGKCTYTKHLVWLYESICDVLPSWPELESWISTG